MTRFLLIFLFAIPLFGCAARPRFPEYRTAEPGLARDKTRAEQMNESGLVALQEGKREEAESDFREALRHDLYSAAAHNNLGVVLLQREAYYESAWEFSAAAKLAPHSAEPLHNLGLLYEQTGRVDQAIDEYEAGLEIDDKNLAVMRSLARAYVKTDRTDDRLTKLLETLLLTPGDPQWDRWTRGQLIRIGRSER